MASSATGFNGAAHERERMHGTRHARGWPRLASMEPPTNVSGCLTPCQRVELMATSFNGAAHERERMQQRAHRARQ